MIYGYARVSTIAQCKNGNSLEEQNEALTAYGCNEIITETYTGKTTERPQFNELLKRLHSGDTLVVTKLDRFARTVIEGVLTVRTLFERGVKVHILNIGLIENTLTGNLKLLSIKKILSAKSLAIQESCLRLGSNCSPSASSISFFACKSPFSEKWLYRNTFREISFGTISATAVASGLSSITISCSRSGKYSPL